MQNEGGPRVALGGTCAEPDDEDASLAFCVGLPCEDQKTSCHGKVVIACSGKKTQVSHICASNQVCKQGKCFGTCQPGKRVCWYNYIATCGEDGTWKEDKEACPAPVNDCLKSGCQIVNWQLKCVETPITKPFGDKVNCDDGDPCTKNDWCDEGTCTGEATCDDGVPCTMDSCASDGTCKHVADDKVCDDGVSCTIDTCTADATMADKKGCEHKACDP